MVWIALAALGVPLWLCALGVLALLSRNRTLRRRGGDLPVRVRREGSTRWIRGHAVWVSEVLAWRGSPAAWREDLLRITALSSRPVDANDPKKLHRLGRGAVVAHLTTEEGQLLEVATSSEHAAALTGPFATGSDATTPPPAQQHAGPVV